MRNSQKHYYLLALDFDETAFHTISPSSVIFSVPDAYGHTIIDIFGMNAYAQFEATGLKNRAASEIIAEIYQSGDRAKLDVSMQEYYREKRVFFDGLVPKSKGISIDENNIAGERVATELLVRGKLSYLIDRIGKPYLPGSPIWPKPTLGFLDFWQTVQDLKLHPNFQLDTAIISSGHDTFIKKVFDTYELPHPDIMITDDDMRAYTYPNDSRLLVKPRPLPLVAAYKEWLAHTEQDFVPKERDGMSSHRLYTALEARDKIMYIGDDIKKDGGLAASGGVPFALYNPLAVNTRMQNGTFSDWRVLGNMLLQSRTELAQGRSVQEIFLDGPRNEVVYPVVEERLVLRRGVER